MLPLRVVAMGARRRRRVCGSVRRRTCKGVLVLGLDGHLGLIGLGAGLLNEAELETVAGG
jgi:hypothetical protein